MYLGVEIKRINTLLEKRANCSLQKIDLTFTQFRTLLYLNFVGGKASLKEMEHHFRVAQPTMAGIIVRLEEKGYVKNCRLPEDKRVKIVELTEEGKALCEQSKTAMETWSEEQNRLYTPEEMKQLEEYLNRFYQYLVEKDRTGGEEDD